MACEKRERTGSCSHYQCPYADDTPHGYECVEIFPGEGCEASCQECPDRCERKARADREPKEVTDARRDTDPFRCRYSDCAMKHPVAREYEQVTGPRCRHWLGLPAL